MNPHIEYSAIQAMNWSTLKHIHTSPKVFQFRLQTPEEDKPAYAMGRALHCAALEPDRFRVDYAPTPDFGDLRTKAGKEAKAAWLADQRPGVEYLKPDDFVDVVNAAAAVREHRVAAQLLGAGRNEETTLWTDAPSGLACKMRTDCIKPVQVVDLKSARRLGSRFISDAADYLYHGQLCFYHDGAIAAGKLPADAALPALVVVQLSAPYDVACYQMTAETYAAGQALYRACLARFLECTAAEVWPGAAPDLLPWTLPGWAAGATMEPEGEEGDF